MDIAEFVIKRNEKMLRELATRTWQLESAKEKVEASKVTRIGRLKTHSTSGLVEGCCGKQLECATEVRQVYGIDTFQIVTIIADLLIYDRTKNRNLKITTSANSAKISILKPLKLIFSGSIFENPANDKYRIEKAESVFAK